MQRYNRLHGHEAGHDGDVNPLRAHAVDLGDGDGRVHQRLGGGLRGAVVQVVGRVLRLVGLFSLFSLGAGQLRLGGGRPAARRR